MDYEPLEHLEEAPRHKTIVKRRLGRQQSFGLIIMLVGMIGITLSFLVGAKPDLTIFIIGGIWAVGGLYLMVST